ncbi:NUDIX hydrolase [Caulobacter sp. KR2-114]|uniref:NUDIX hydrolase n=1 Tax=Caulobacter sp. KR2-114 TaxID=3400912 RepID=UPI003C0DF570
MARAPFQVLVLPFRRGPDGLAFAVFRRADGDGTLWQGLAGGGEDDETPEAAARREMGEEAGIDPAAALIALPTKTLIPTDGWKGRQPWADVLQAIPEHAFAVELATGVEPRLSDEHLEYRWLDFAAASARLTWDGNRAALAALRALLDGQGDTHASR